MPLSRVQLKSLEPRRNPIGDPTESPQAYADRVQQLLPNFPEPVITHWFRDHHQVIEEHASLNYSTLKFRLASFGLAEFSLPCLAEHQTVVQYRNYFMQGVKSQKMQRIAEYIKTHRTWPAAPLVFDNPDGRFVASWGLNYSRPYDLLEGHHRMAVLYGLGLHKTGEHQVWLVQRPSKA